VQPFIKQTLSNIKDNQTIDSNSFEKLLINTYRLLDSKDSIDYNLCLSVICHVANINHKDNMVQQLLYDCIIKYRVFLYNNLLIERNANFQPLISAQDVLLQSFYTSNKTNTILTRPQKEIFNAFQAHRRLVVSAPTSFGKTRIIREIISHNHYKNIVLIMPTVSLLSEQYQDIKKNIEGYTLSKSSKVKIDVDRKYILILTPERISAFLEEHPDFKIDFFVMDEIYKIDFKLDDGRFRVFSDILYRLAKTTADYYLIGPYISDFSQKFRDNFSVKFVKYDVEIVQKDFYSLDNIKNKGSHNIEQGKVKIIGDKFINLLRIVSQESIDGKFLIYRYQKRYVEETAKKFLETWPVKPHNDQLVEYLSNTVSADWDLISCIKRGGAFHHGAMPRHIQDLIVDEFNDSSKNGIDYLFCTTSLTEGINSAAKNVVIYDKKIGTGELLKSLDRKNIEGRAGRFMRHFIGRVFYLEAPEDVEGDTTVGIEYLDSPNPSIETLIQLEDSDLSETTRKIKENLYSSLEMNGIPESIVRNNKFVNVDGQIQLINYLRKSNNLDKFYFESSLPNLETSREILSKIYEFLFTDHDKGKNFDNEVGKSILIQLTNYYIYHTPPFKQLLISDTVTRARESINSRIRYVFDLTSKYFEFVWPKYLKSFENIYNFVATEKHQQNINLDMLVARLEYGTTAPHEIILRDSGLPNEVIGKISDYFRGCENFEDVQRIKIEKSADIRKKIHSIEQKILDKYI